ncbi:cAMP phosphodiesterases class-II [Thermosulfidibacter takaii ABI70S6]|uniref:cAMP phosphodiesterases class-II n=1 Tax=Thermosulfidibacter takaii (strain DSM 17441 / JCM 13301 / NBRC 103674 / ABI70S6) TaxID=1298851 RepID=A0A0S3QTP6_THET7|nr:MBL fold metallo-hydrolase [Thermosulfidibacter takaii]BAT71705.1 cAMP phosphodiesterases class-II [Thermosulfidibacter takaii ABI70S6]
MKFKVLGDEAFPYTPVSFLVGENIAIDASNVIRTLKDDIRKIRHVILTHCHMDHILELPLIVDYLCWSLKQKLCVWGNEHTVKVLKEHVFNNNVWPKIPDKFLTIKVFSSEETFTVEGVKFLPVPANHSVPTHGFLINESLLLTGDTMDNPKLWEVVQKFSPKILLIDISWPSSLKKIAHISGHFSAQEAIDAVQRGKISAKIYAYHLKPAFFEETEKEIEGIFKVLYPGTYFEL